MSAIILVEDEPDILLLMTDVLEMEGHQVKAFPKADSAWNHIRQCGFDADLLITDLRMSGTIDGLQLVHNVHDLLPEVPVMVVSGTTLPQTALPKTGCAGCKSLSRSTSFWTSATSSFPTDGGRICCRQRRIDQVTDTSVTQAAVF